MCHAHHRTASSGRRDFPPPLRFAAGQNGRGRERGHPAQGLTGFGGTTRPAARARPHRRADERRRADGGVPARVECALRLRDRRIRGDRFPRRAGRSREAAIRAGAARGLADVDGGRLRARLGADGVRERALGGRHGLRARSDGERFQRSRARRHHRRQPEHEGARPSGFSRGRQPPADPARRHAVDLGRAERRHDPRDAAACVPVCARAARRADLCQRVEGPVGAARSSCGDPAGVAIPAGAGADRGSYDRVTRGGRAAGRGDAGDRRRPRDRTLRRRRSRTRDRRADRRAGLLGSVRESQRHHVSDPAPAVRRLLR